MKTIVFQGDSITDVGRSRSNDNERGLGYPHLVTAKLGSERPGEFKFFNRGISGNRVVDLYARIKADFINLSPDYLSILIGINDVWHEVGGRNGVDAEKYEKIYGMLIEEIKAALPEIKIIIMEPFVLKGTATEGAWDYFRDETALRATAAKRIAERYDLAFMPLQHIFDQACEKAPADYWLADGVHPTAYGHELITKEWLRVFGEIE